MTSPTILAIDPGPEMSAFVWLRDGKLLDFNKLENDALFGPIEHAAIMPGSILVIEQIKAMGMAVGAEVFETVFWSGRFAQACVEAGGSWDRIGRGDVKMHLCGSMRAKDPNIRAALMDLYGPGKEKAIGTKKAPGPLFGVAGDVWAALAVAVTYQDTKVSALQLQG